jgi:hypothetical protein
MIALAAVIKDYWHAVERDLLDLGYHADDIGTKLTTCELISIVLAAQPGTAVQHFNPNSWSRTEELIANLTEQQAGLLSLNARYARPKVDPTPVKPRSEFDTLPPYKGIVLEPMPVDEFTAKLKARQKAAREGIGK